MESKFFIALLMFVLIVRLSAQPYPVDAFVRMHPPFSPYLDDWSSPATSPISLQLRLQDPSEDQYPVQLRMSWLGQGIRVTTKTDFPREPLLLDYGVPLELRGSDLAAYLDWNNLQLEGIDLNTLYQNGGRLPEGIYNFCVEVLDAQRPNEAPLSNQACILVQLDLLPPPQLLSPTAEQHIKELPINFQWVPQHVGNFPVQYNLRLYEKRPGLSNLQILNNTPPLFSVNTQGSTHFLYDWDEPALASGMSYLVQIQIEDVLEKHHFQAQGLSEVYAFHFGEAQATSVCQLTSPSVQVHLQDSQSLLVLWSKIAQSDGYEIQVASDSNFLENISIQYTHSVTDTFVNFSGLVPQGSYFVRTRAIAGECFSAFTQLGPITVSSRCQSRPELDIIAYSCGIEDEEITLGIPSSILELQAGDSIWAHHFPVVITEVYGHGPFSGKAYGHLAYLRQAQVNFQLQNIEVDQYCRLVSGQLVVTGGGIKVLGTNDLALLNEILSSLDAMEDWLATSEVVLSAIDQFIAALENYLPQEIIDNLIQAQHAAKAAQEAYESALGSDDPDALQAAKEALDETSANLKEALESYKEALLHFLRTWLEIAVQVFTDLLQDCLWSQLKTAYQVAGNNLQNLIKTDTEVALNSLPAFAGNLQPLYNESELVIIESAHSAQPEAFDQLSSEFYSREMDYLLCHTLKRLETEIQSPETVAAFQQVLEEINARSLAAIGEAISVGVPTEEIVQEVKGLIFEDLQLLIKRSSYPSSISLSSE